MASEIAYAKEHHIPIFEIEHPEEKEFYPISADENQLLGRHSCEPDSQEQNYEGKILVMNYDALKEEYRSRPFQLWLATGGFGAVQVPEAEECSRLICMMGNRPAFTGRILQES